MKRFSPRWIYRIFVVIFFFTNMVIVNTFGVEPLFLLRLGAIMDGLLLSPIQALIIALALFWIMPRLLSEEPGKCCVRAGFSFSACCCRRWCSAISLW